MSDEFRTRFASAFIAQAKSDWEVYELLGGAEAIPVCHSLHYLQMTCEKMAKAYRLRDSPESLDEITSHHTGFRKFVHAFLRSPTVVAEYQGRDAQLRKVCSLSSKFAREIEKLAPSVDRAATPENA